jgi:hypothetical protein
MNFHQPSCVEEFDGMGCGTGAGEIGQYLATTGMNVHP